MENRDYNIDQMLLFLKENDSYSKSEVRIRSGQVKYDTDKDKESESEEYNKKDTNIFESKKIENKETFEISEKKSD